MRLETAGSIDSHAVTAEELHEAFRDDEGRGEFIILSQRPQVYIQAAGEADGFFELEYRDGSSKQHFRAGGELRKDDVERAFLWYLAEDSRWRTEFRWQKLELKPWWKMW